MVMHNIVVVHAAIRLIKPGAAQVMPYGFLNVVLILSDTATLIADINSAIHLVKPGSDMCGLANAVD
jgi:hypothetical protein